MQEVASSTQAHAAHARAHGSRHAKPQRGSDFEAMLDELASAKANPLDQPPTTSPAQAPSEQKPDIPIKAGETGEAAQNPAASAPAQLPDTPLPDDVAKAAGVTPAPAPLDLKAAQKPAAMLPSEPQPEKQFEDARSPDGTEKPVEAATIVTQSGASTPPAASPVPIPTQAAGTPAQQPPPSNPAAQDLALVAPAGRQMSQAVKAAKQGDPPAQAAGDDLPQAPAPSPEQAPALLSESKPASLIAPPQTHENEAATGHRPSLDLASNKPDASQPIDDLLDAGNAPGNAAPSGSVAASPANPSASAAPVSGSSASAPQVQLAPVPLSGIPVLIAGKALAGSNHFDIRLDPPELGRIEVRLKVGRDGQVSSHLIADRADTLALLRRDQTGLERALQDAGLKTGGDGLQFSLRDQGGNAQSDGRSGTSTLLVQDNSNPTPDLPRGYARYATRAGGIDIHV